jgi:hypothetical protein
MTPEQKIKRTILQRAIAHESIDPIEGDINAANVDALFESNNDDYQLQDYINEFRSGEVETGLKCDWSRHYESKSVASKLLDGTWVGWTYWYGGGKHGEPEAVDWLEDAYELTCKEEERMVVVREFTRVEQVTGGAA